MGKINSGKTILRHRPDKIQFTLPNIYLALTTGKILSVFPLLKTSEMRKISSGSFIFQSHMHLGVLYSSSYKKFYCKRAPYTFIAILRLSYSSTSHFLTEEGVMKRNDSCLHVSNFISPKEHEVLELIKFLTCWCNLKIKSQN